MMLETRKNLRNGVLNPHIDFFKVINLWVQRYFPEEENCRVWIGALLERNGFAVLGVRIRTC
jgi:hypothetical protein